MVNGYYFGEKKNELFIFCLLLGATFICLSPKDTFHFRGLYKFWSQSFQWRPFSGDIFNIGFQW